MVTSLLLVSIIFDSVSFLGSLIRSKLTITNLLFRVAYLRPLVCNVCSQSSRQDLLPQMNLSFSLLGLDTRILFSPFSYIYGILFKIWIISVKNSKLLLVLHFYFILYFMPSFPKATSQNLKITSE